MSVNVVFYGAFPAPVQSSAAASTSPPRAASPLRSVSAASPALLAPSAASPSPAAAPGFLQPLAPAPARFQRSSSVFGPATAAHQ